MAFMRGIIAPCEVGRIEFLPQLCFQALGQENAWIEACPILSLFFRSWPGADMARFGRVV
jgi:hypothetical protein